MNQPGVAAVYLLSHVWLFAPPWTVVHQAPLSMGFSRKEYWSGLTCPSLGELPDPGIEPMSPGKESACQCRRHRDGGSIPGLGRSSGVGNGTPLQYSCLENPMDKGAWRATIPRVAKSQTWLSDWACTHSSIITISKESMKLHFLHYRKLSKYQRQLKYDYTGLVFCGLAGNA